MQMQLRDDDYGRGGGDWIAGINGPAPMNMGAVRLAKENEKKDREIAAPRTQLAAAGGGAGPVVVATAVPVSAAV